MSAVRDYQEARKGSLYAVTALTIAIRADAAIAELEAELSIEQKENRRLCKRLKKTDGKAGSHD